MQDIYWPTLEFGQTYDNKEEFGFARAGVGGNPTTTPRPLTGRRPIRLEGVESPMVFRFLQSIFAATPAPSGKSDATLIRAAIERVVNGTDPRLRFVNHYQRILWHGVERSVEHVSTLIDSLPPAFEVSKREFTAEPRLRALFASSEHLREILSFGPALEQYRQQHANALPAVLYAALGVDRIEKKVLGVDLQGDMLRRDVAQTTVNFRNHRLAFLTESETETRWELKKQAFDYLIEIALKRLISIRTRREQLEREQRHLLQKQARLLKSAKLGLEPLLETGSPEVHDPAAIDRQLREVRAELDQMRADSATIEDHLERVASTLREPEQHLRMERVTFTLDHMNQKVAPNSSRVASTLTFDDTLLGDDRRFTTLLVRFPTSEILPKPDFFEEAHRLLTL